MPTVREFQDRVKYHERDRGLSFRDAMQAALDEGTAEIAKLRADLHVAQEGERLWKQATEEVTKLREATLLQNDELKSKFSEADFEFHKQHDQAQQWFKKWEESNRLYNELVMLVVPQHLWISTGARYSDGHDDCETCDWLEKNTKFGEKSKTEKPVEAPCKKCWEDVNGRWVHQGSCVCRCHIEKRNHDVYQPPAGGNLSQ